ILCAPAPGMKGKSWHLPGCRSRLQTGSVNPAGGAPRRNICSCWSGRLISKDWTSRGPIRRCCSNQVSLLTVTSETNDEDRESQSVCCLVQQHLCIYGLLCCMDDVWCPWDSDSSGAWLERL